MTRRKEYRLYLRPNRRMPTDRAKKFRKFIERAYEDFLPALRRAQS
jgi:hypothetical protein